MEDGEVLYECGIDLDSNLHFSDGDVNLVKYKDNLFQAIKNRLNTNLDELNLLYESEYGSILRGFLGWKATEDTLDYMQAEVDNVLLAEPRIIAHTSELEYVEGGKVLIKLEIYTSSMIALATNFILTNTGVVDAEGSTEEEN